MTIDASESNPACPRPLAAVAPSHSGVRCRTRRRPRVGAGTLLALALAVTAMPFPGRGEGRNHAAWAATGSSGAEGGAAAREGLSREAIHRQIEQIVRETDVGDAVVAWRAVDVVSGEQLSAGSARNPMIPASNMKLVTTGAALAVLGPEFTFQTEIRLVDGAVWIVGGGDPGFGDDELLREMGLDANQFLDVLAADVKRMDLPLIREVVVDARVFDNDRYHPGWPSDDQYQRPYCAEIAGLNFFGNALAFYARPSGTEDAPPTWWTEPDVQSWIRVSCNARTRKAGNNAFWVSRRPREANEFGLHGEVRFATQTPAKVTVHDPASFFAELFRRRLIEAGMQVGPARVAAETDAEAGGDILRVVRTPLLTALTRCNRDSDNLFAEALLKRIGYEVTGQPGSWTNGATVLRMMVRNRLGPDLGEELFVSDGSGLSRLNRVSPEVMTNWLAALYRDPKLRDAYLGTLAVAGENGTLRRRFRSVDVDQEVLAKSGFINGVSCLSGYVVDESRQAAVAFSVMVNERPAPSRPLSVANAKRLQERVVDVLDAWVTEQATTVRLATPTASATPAAVP